MNKKQERVMKRVIFWMLMCGAVFGGSQIWLVDVLLFSDMKLVEINTARIIGIVSLILAGVALLWFGSVVIPPFDEIDLQEKPEELGS